METGARDKEEIVYMPMSELWREGVLVSILKDWTCKSAGLTSPWDGQEILLKFSHDVAQTLQGPLVQSSQREFIARERFLIQIASYLKAHSSYKDREIYDQLHCALHLYFLRKRDLDTSPAALIYRYGGGDADSSRKRKRTGGSFQRESKAGSDDNFDGSTQDSAPGTSSSNNTTSPSTSGIRYSRPHFQHFPSAWELVYLYGEPRVSLSRAWPQDSLIYLSQLLPRSFDSRKRAKLLDILLHPSTPFIPAYMHYVPQNGTCIVGFRGLRQDLRSAKSNLTFENLSQPLSPPNYVSKRPLSASSTKSGLTWPGTRLPVEIFALITSYLPREDIQSMRLVNRHFERCISMSMFRTVVVPFRSELHDLLLSNKKPEEGTKGKFKDLAEKAAFGKEIQPPGKELNHTILSRVQASPPKSVDRGMRVFQGWGPHIKRFAMAFELDEDILKYIRAKRTQEIHSSFWGDYMWPCTEYNRFPSVESLEQAADKSKYISEAFSYLISVSELALSLDSGLGWLHGADVSRRARHFKTKPTVFGNQNQNPASVDELRITSWKRYLSGPKELLLLISDILADVKLDQVALCRYMELLMDCKILDVSSLSLIVHYMKANPTGRLHWLTPDTLDDYVQNFMLQAGQSGNNEQSRSFFTIQHLLYSVKYLSSFYLNHQPPAPRPPPTLRELMRVRQPDGIWQTESQDDQELEQPQPQLEDHSDLPLIFEGVNYGTVGDATTLENSYKNDCRNKADRYLSIKPNSLTPSQLEYLLEMGWAQSAFLHSWMLAVIDNTATFANVRTFTLARLSSCFLPVINRADLWDALPGLQTLTINVSPDWRSLEKRPSAVLDYIILPSEAVRKYYDLLRRVLRKQTIKTLSIGYIGSGEHAEGFFARNQHILPAPIMDNELSRILSFTFVRSLTFSNCWFMPDVLIDMVRRLESCVELKFLSVSLVAQGGYPDAMQANGIGNWEATGAQLAQSYQATTEQDGEGYGLPAAIEIPQPHHPGFWFLQPAQYDGIPQDLDSNSQLQILTRPFRVPHTEPAPPEDLWTNPEWLRVNVPRGTWAYALERISPGASIAQTRHIRDAGPEPRPRNPSLPRRMFFESCGYVKLPFQVFTPPYLFTEYRHYLHNTGYFSENSHHMLSTRDDFLGEIIPKVHPKEEKLLRYVFGMEFGWRGAKQFEPREDQRTFGGTGRFTGILERAGDGRIL